jgi:hypothetical protein
MSQENVETVRRMIDAGNASGWSVEAVVQFFLPTWVGQVVPEWPGPGRYRGHDGLAELLDEWTADTERFELELRDQTDAGDHTISRLRMRQVAQGQTLQVDAPLFAVDQVRDGAIAETCWFLTKAEARVAAGLPASHANALHM